MKETEIYFTENIDRDAALCVYCCTCGHVLMRLDTTAADRLDRARTCAEAHWTQFSKNHTVVVMMKGHLVAHI